MPIEPPLPVENVQVTGKRNWLSLIVQLPFDVVVKRPQTHPPLQKIELKLGEKAIVID